MGGRCIGVGRNSVAPCNGAGEKIEDEKGGRARG
jgi:hypothetical protein